MSPFFYRLCLATSALFLTGLTACVEHGRAGALIPLAGVTGSNAKVVVSGSTVRLTSDSVVAEISGEWSTQTGDAVKIDYKNSGTQAFEFKWTDFNKKALGVDVALSGASDLTGVDLTDKRTDNDFVKPLYQAAASTPVKGQDTSNLSFSIAPNQSKKLYLAFGNYSPTSSVDKKKPVQSGDEIEIRFAMPSGPITVRFKRG